MNINNELAKKLENFRLPRFNEITNVGLYLEQTTKFINQSLSLLNQPEITTSMISNYVKLKLIPNPQKKQYSNNHIALLILISLAKTVISLDDIRYLLTIQSDNFAQEKTYDLFCEEFEAYLKAIFGIKDQVIQPPINSSNERELMDSIITTIVQKIYLDHYLYNYRNSVKSATNVIK